MDKNHNLPAEPQMLMAFPHGSDYADHGSESESHIRDYWQVILKRKWWVIGCFVFVVSLVALVTWSMTPIYRATTTLRLTFENEGSNVVARDQMNPLFRDDEKIIETHFQILRSRSLSKRVIDILKLGEHPEFASDTKGEDVDEDETNANLVDGFLGRLQTERVKRTDLIDISFLAADRNLARRVANAMAGEYMQFEIDSKNQSFSHIKVWLEKQLVQLGHKVEGSQRKLYASGDAGEILSPEDKENVIIQRYLELSGLLTKASAERIAREAQYSEVKKEGVGASPITNNPLIQGLRQNIAVEAAKVAGLQKIYLPDHPKLQAEQANFQGLQARLNSEIQNVRTSVETDYNAARRTENLLLEAVENQKTKVADLQKKLVQYKILKRDVEANEELYKGLLTRMKEASVASTMVPSTVAVIDPAEKPLRPYRPNKPLNMALAVLMGLMGGMIMAFVVEYFDDSIKTADEAERICHLPTLGMVPVFRGRKELVEPGSVGLGLITYQDQKSMMSDAILVVRTAVLLSSAGGPPAAIMITSPNPLEGKSTMASNLAVSFAMSGRRVVLVDGDLRRPSVHKTFKCEPQPGLSDILTGSVSLEEAIRPTDIPNLFIITAGTIPPNPVNLLGSTAFEETMHLLREQFQHIFIDSPPTLSLPDSRVMSAMVDKVILVIRHHYTPRETARMARQVLSQVNADVIGVILNQVAFHKSGYGGYYYKKYHHYYYSSDQEQKKLSS